MMCFRNLKHRRLRTLLCISGIALAVAFMVGIGATTSRVMAIINEMNTFFKDDLVVVARDVFVIQGFPIGGTIPETIVDELKEIKGVDDVIPMLFSLDLKTGEASRIFPANVTIGFPLEKFSLMISMSKLQLHGQLPVNSSKDVLIGGSIADQYDLFVGSTLHLKNRNLTICGILRGPSFVLSRSIVMSLKLAQEIYRYKMRISMAIVKPDPHADVERLANEIENKINYVMVLTENERNELTAPILDEMKLWDHGIRLTLFLMSIMLISTVEIMNVSESRRDFATLIAIGASKLSIFRMVLAETALIGFIGGFFGLFLGGTIAVFIASSYTSIPALMFIQNFFELVSPFLAVEILALTIAVCCVSGVIPAIFVLKMNINEALRSEY